MPVCAKIQVCCIIFIILCTYLVISVTIASKWLNNFFKYADNNRCIVGNEQMIIMSSTENVSGDNNSFYTNYFY